MYLQTVIRKKCYELLTVHMCSSYVYLHGEFLEVGFFFALRFYLVHKYLGLLLSSTCCLQLKKKKGSPDLVQNAGVSLHSIEAELVGRI